MRLGRSSSVKDSSDFPSCGSEVRWLHACAIHPDGDFFPEKTKSLLVTFLQYLGLLDARTDYCNVAFEAFGCGVRKLHGST